MTAAFPPPPPAGPAGPPPGQGSSGPGWILVLLGGLLVTGALLAGVALLWPGGDDGGGDPIASSGTTVLTPLTTAGATDAGGEPSATIRPASPTPSSLASVNLLQTGAMEAYQDLVDSARARQVLEVLVYPEYAYLAYRDPAQPAHIDQRQWRNGVVSNATPNLIDDRYNADTAPKLFTAADLDLTELPHLVDDAAGRFAEPVAVTHVIIDRFLPFDERVLIRVYASPADGRGGGGYVEYLPDGTYVKTVE